MTDAKQYLKKLTNFELMTLKNEMSQMTIPEDTLLRRVINDIFGQVTILTLQILELIWPLLEVITERFVAYSQHIDSQLKAEFIKD